MGFFSWLTADDKVSVSSSYSSRGAKTVHLLQPNGQPPITEADYEGYGVFGGVDAYVWLARTNMPATDLVGLDEEKIRDIGCALDMGSYYRDTQTGDLLSIFHRIPDAVQKLHGLKIEHLGVHYQKELDRFGGKTSNDLVAEKRFVEIALPRVTHPIKLSHDANAIYENLPASDSCPQQGYFYEDEEYDEAA